MGSYDDGRRVLFVISRLGRGGAERQLVHLAKALARRGWPVTVCIITDAPLDTAEMAAAGVEVVLLGAPHGPARATSLPALIRLARRADLVHCTLWDASLWGRVAAIAAGRPAVVTDHSTDRGGVRNSRGRPRARWIAGHNRLLDRFTAVTIACARSQIPILVSEGVRRERITYIPNGVPVADMVEAARDGVTREQLGIPAAAPLVAQIARFEAMKNQELTYETVARLRETLGDVHVLFVGDGGLRQAIESRAREDGATWAHFVGRRSDVPRLLSLADLAVLPSRAEAMPMALIEALALATPVVATAVGDMGSLLDETGAGIAVEEGDGEAFLRACHDVLADAALRGRLAQAARAAAARYDAEQMAATYADLFEQVATRGPVGLPSAAASSAVAL